jgi:hypothetical protein
LFDRLVAFSGRIATAGFLIYVADASGYFGSVALLLWRNFGESHLNWVEFFKLSAYGTSIVGVTSTAFAALYFWRRAPAKFDPIAAQTRAALAAFTPSAS